MSGLVLAGPLSARRGGAPAKCIGAALSLVLAAACAVGPKYQPPAPPQLPPAFKELGPWKDAQPRDAVPRGPWWEVYGDPQLDALHAQLSVSNNTLRAAQAQFEQARALVRGARAASFPLVTGAASATRTSQSENRPNVSRNPDFTDYLLRFDASYELDVWGRVRQTVDASRAAAQASAADLESVNLSLHAELALAYLQLRAADAEQQILETTVTNLEQALALTQRRYRGGVASGIDVAQAETQLETTRAQAIDVRARRAQLEHAIAVLVGQPASGFSLPPAPLDLAVPAIPPGLPADVLERRPDIAAAERRLAAANAQVGIASTAYYPVLLLTGSTGFESATLGNWLKLASNFWSAAPIAAAALFDGGRRRSVSDQAKAAYDRAEAIYRETLLVALREVEDNLAALRILSEEAATQERAVAAAERLLTLSTNRYQGGVATYLEVVVAQNALLGNQRTALSIQSRRLAATVLLAKAIGGGWNVSRLPLQ